MISAANWRLWNRAGRSFISPPYQSDQSMVVLVNLDVIGKLRIVILPSVSARAYYFGVVSNSLHIIPESNGVTD
jgi:hypothetical protein